MAPKRRQAGLSAHNKRRQSQISHLNKENKAPTPKSVRVTRQLADVADNYETNVEKPPPTSVTIHNWMTSMGRHSTRLNYDRDIFVDMVPIHHISVHITSSPSIAIADEQSRLGGVELRHNGITLPVDRFGLPTRIRSRADAHAVCMACDALRPCLGIGLPGLAISIRDLGRWQQDRQQISCQVKLGNVKLGASLRLGSTRSGPYLAASGCAILVQDTADGTHAHVCLECSKLRRQLEETRPAPPPGVFQATPEVVPQCLPTPGRATARSTARLLGRCRRLRLVDTETAFPLSATLTETPLQLVCGVDMSLTFGSPWTRNTYPVPAGFPINCAELQMVSSGDLDVLLGSVVACPGISLDTTATLLGGLTCGQYDIVTNTHPVYYGSLELGVEWWSPGRGRVLHSSCCVVLAPASNEGACCHCSHTLKRILALADDVRAAHSTTKTSLEATAKQLNAMRAGQVISKAELDALQTRCSHLSRQAMAYMQASESKEEELEILKQNLIKLECEGKWVELNITNCLRCPETSLDSMQDYMQKMLPYLSALIIDTVVTAEAKLLGTPTVCRKTQRGITLSVNLKRLLGSSYAGYLDMTNFGHLSDSHVDNYVNNVSTLPGVHPEPKRMAMNLFKAMGKADDPANLVIATPIDAMKQMAGLATGANARDLHGYDNLCGGSASEYDTLKHLVQPGANKEPEMSAALATHVQQIMLVCLRAGVKFHFPDSFQFSAASPDVISLTTFWARSTWLDKDVGFIPLLLPADNGSENVKLREILGCEDSLEVLKHHLEKGSYDAIFNGQASAKSVSGFLVCIAPWDPCDIVIMVGDMVHVLKNTRSQAFASAVPDATTVAQATEAEKAAMDAMGNNDLGEPDVIRGNGLQPSESRAKVGPTLVPGGISVLVTPVDGTKCVFTGSKTNTAGSSFNTVLNGGVSRPPLQPLSTNRGNRQGVAAQMSSRASQECAAPAPVNHQSDYYVRPRNMVMGLRHQTGVRFYPVVWEHLRWALQFDRRNPPGLRITRLSQPAIELNAFRKMRESYAVHVCEPGVRAVLQQWPEETKGTRLFLQQLAALSEASRRGTQADGLDASMIRLLGFVGFVQSWQKQITALSKVHQSAIPNTPKSKGKKPFNWRAPARLILAPQTQSSLELTVFGLCATAAIMKEHYGAALALYLASSQRVEGHFQMVRASGGDSRNPSAVGVIQATHHARQQPLISASGKGSYDTSDARQDLSVLDQLKLKPRRRGREPWGFDVSDQRRVSLFDSTLHPNSSEDEDMALSMLQHLHSMVLHLEDFQGVQAMREDGYTAVVLEALTSRLSLNIDASLATSLPPMTEVQSEVITAVADTIRCMHRLADVSSLPPEVSARTAEKQKRFRASSQWRDSSRSGRHVFNAWATVLGLQPHREPLTSYSQHQSMWNQVPPPLRNLISRIAFESFVAALAEGDLQWRLSDPSLSANVCDEVPDRFDRHQAREVMRYLAGWMCLTMIRNTSPKDPKTSKHHSSNPLHSEECQYLACRFRAGQYRCDIRGRDAMDPEVVFTAFIDYLFGEVETLCNAKTLSKYQERTFHRAMWKLESSQVVWEHWLNLVELSIRNRPVGDDHTTAQNIQHALDVASNGNIWRSLADEQDQATMRADRVLTNLRRMLGLLVNKFVSFFQRRVLDDRDLQPQKVRTQAESHRAQIGHQTAPRKPYQPASVNRSPVPEIELGLSTNETAEPVCKDPLPSDDMSYVRDMLHEDELESHAVAAHLADARQEDEFESALKLTCNELRDKLDAENIVYCSKMASDYGHLLRLFVSSKGLDKFLNSYR